MRNHVAAWALGLTLVPAIAFAGHRESISFTANIDDDAKSVLTCDDIEMKFWKSDVRRDEYVTVRRSQTLALPATGSRALRVRAASHGGIRVQPSSDGKLSALVCMAAGARTEAAAEEMLGKLTVDHAAGELTVSGPDDDLWAAYIVLSVPDDVSLDLSSENGELTVRGVSGNFTLRTMNGPMSLWEVGGVVDGEAVNGPIQYRGHAGDIRLTAENGPVGVVLDAPTWTGKGLTARTTNGPVQFKAPENLRSGVQVEGSAHSPFMWNGVTQPSYDEWRRAHSVWLGEGRVVVRLSTENGPVEIQAPKAKARSSRTRTI